jgi:alpha-beta hydrolase superfamily lysophospholipase
MHGTEDKATICHGGEFFHKTAGSQDKTLKLHEGHYHDLLNDHRQRGRDRRHHVVGRRSPAGMTNQSGARV